MNKGKKVIALPNIKYDPESGILYRLRICRNNIRDIYETRVQYIECGDYHTRGYVTFSYNNKTYYVHRFVWEMHYGPIPDGYLIDHINGNKKDNRLDNLRIVTHEESQKNRPLSVRNTSGYPGIYWSKRDNKWRVQISINKKNVFVGSFYSKIDAIEARKKLEEIHKYHPNNGRTGAIIK